MKAHIDSTTHSSSQANILSLRSTQDGKIQKPRQASLKEEENEEIKAYLAKLQELVPFMPKNRKLSKLEVVTYVIEYIRDLRTTLGLPPQSRRTSCGSLANSRDLVEPFELMAQANLSLSVMSTNSSNSFSSPSRASISHSYPSHQSHSRLPLVVISTSNTASLNGSCASQEIPQLIEKSSTIDLDTRPLSC